MVQPHLEVEEGDEEEGMVKHSISQPPLFIEQPPLTSANETMLTHYLLTIIINTLVINNINTLVINNINTLLT